MQKSLAVAALLGVGAGVDVKKLPERAEQGIQIAKGFLIGSATAEGFDDIPNCIQDLESVVSSGESAIADFKKKNVDGMIDGFKQVAGILSAIKKSEDDCKLVKADWGKIEKMAKTWHSPMRFIYHAGKDILLNGKDIYSEVSTAITDYNSKNWYDFGVQIGKASSQILLGKIQLMALGPDLQDLPKGDPTQVSKFPGWSSVRAKCQINTTLHASCADSLALVHNALQTKTDAAHLKPGKYTVQQYGKDFVFAHRKTANEQYTDNVQIKVLGESGDKCNIEGRSQSQGWSFYDYNVNFCNIFNALRMSGLQVGDLDSSNCRFSVSDDELEKCNRY